MRSSAPARGSRPNAMVWLSGMLVLTTKVVAKPYLDKDSTTTLFEWEMVDYDWDAIGISREEAISRGEDAELAAAQFHGAFIPKNNAITGLKWYDGDYYVTVPRWLPGVPSTMNKLVNTSDKYANPVLQPYPLNGTEPQLRYTQSMEIDYHGRMWMLDVGRLNFASSYAESGTPALVLWDMKKNKQLDRYEFPSSVASPDSSQLNDLVLDVPRKIAYISDTQGYAIVIVDMNSHESARFHGQPYTSSESSYKWTIGDVHYGNSTLGGGPDAIALTPNRKWLYWCPLQGTTMFKIKTKYLRWFLTGEKSLAEALTHVTSVGSKRAASDGMAFASNGILYSGGNANCMGDKYTSNNDHCLAVWAWDRNDPLFNTTNIADNLWADTFAFDGSHNLLWTRNNLASFFAGTMNFTDGTKNFRILQTHIYAGSYQLTAEKHQEAAHDNPVYIHPVYWVLMGTAIVLFMVAIFVVVANKKKSARKKNDTMNSRNRANSRSEGNENSFKFGQAVDVSNPTAADRDSGREFAWSEDSFFGEDSMIQMPSDAAANNAL
jgi:sugar lactone lactonase YvrE